MFGRFVRLDPSQGPIPHPLSSPGTAWSRGGQPPARKCRSIQVPRGGPRLGRRYTPPWLLIDARPARPTPGGQPWGPSWAPFARVPGRSPWTNRAGPAFCRGRRAPGAGCLGPEDPVGPPGPAGSGTSVGPAQAWPLDRSAPLKLDRSAYRAAPGSPWTSRMPKGRRPAASSSPAPWPAVEPLREGGIRALCGARPVVCADRQKGTPQHQGFPRDSST